MENNYNGLEIAVIGMSGKFPKSRDIETFWENLKEGKELITFFNNEELREAGISDELLNNPNYIKAQGYLEDSEFFDAAFFGYTPEEAEVMDPQIRLFHEYSWKALEDAGYVPGKYSGLIGVYAGASSKFDWEASKFIKGQDTWENLQVIDKDHLATRIAYKLNLKGPALTIYSACSTSLVTINTACLGILSGQCDIAIAGGVTIHPEKAGYLYEEGMISSPDGHNRTFDENAGGTIGGSGVGVVVLKRLQDAISDGDNIYAIVKGFSINNDGSRKVGFTAPSIEGQAEVINAAIQMAEVEFESISYVECHGTATNLGDPVEVEGLKLAFDTEKRNYCAIGSVKSNTGHLDSAAGVIGFIKTVLCIKNRMLVPSLHFKNPNPKMELPNSPFYVNVETKMWENSKYPLRAGVTSLGVGGTNAHIILEEPPQIKTISNGRDYNLLLVSGKTKEALKNNTQNLKEYFNKNKNIELADVAFTLNNGREHFNYRNFIVLKCDDEVSVSIGDKVKLKSKVSKNTKKNVVFMFSGQGAQYENMGKGLYEKEFCFKENFDKCSEIIKRRLGFDIREILFVNENNSNSSNKIDQVLYTQPIKFAFEYSIAKLLMDVGIEPDYMIGHSFGEIGAACLSGVFSLEDALEVVALRAELMESVEPGLMMSVNMSESEVNNYIKKHKNVSLAAVNSSDLCIVSGEINEIEEFERVINKDGYDSLMLRVPRAGHSNMMDPILEQFKQGISQMQLNEPQIPYISGLSGDWITKEEAVSDNYWGRHLKETIRFSDGISKLFNEGDTIFIQLGPDRGLVSFVELHEGNGNDKNALNIIRHKNDIIDDNEYFLNQIGELWLNSVEINWGKYYSKEKRRKVSLPTYEFDKQKFDAKVDLFKLINQTLEKRGLGDKKRRKMSQWFYTPSWSQAILYHKKEELITGKKVLVFCNESKLCTELILSLQEIGVNIIEVWPNSEFEVIHSKKYRVRIGNKDDFTLLKKYLTQEGRLFNSIIHFWSFGEGVENNDSSVHEIEINKGYSSIVNIAKELLNTLVDESQIVAITSGAYNITDLEILYPERAMIGTLLKVIGQENPGVNTKVIDLDYSHDSENILLSKIINEIFTSTKERLIAYRNGKRLVESYRILDVEIKQKSEMLKDGGVYVITGGFGGIGLDVGEYLGKTYKAKIILIGRSHFPDRAEWNSWLYEKGEDDAISKKIKVVKEIEKEGGTVRIYNVDVSLRKKLEIIFNEINEEFGIVNGVFHFAGATNQDYFVPVTKLTDDISKAQFNPKLYGLMALRHIIEKQNIDFCFVTSSVSSILGGIEFGAYACSNAYMDALICRDIRDGKIPWINVNLDGWISNRDEKDKEALSELFVQTKEGIVLVENILAIKEGGIGNIVQSISDLDERLNKWTININKEDLDQEYNTKSNQEFNQEIEQIYYSRPEISNDYVEPRTEREKEMAEIWGKFFRYEKIGIYDDFFELGGNSLKAMRLFALLHRNYGVRISVKEIFVRPNIALISEYINENVEEIII